MTWLMEHVSHDDAECLTWPFGRSTAGYGGFGASYAHRKMCELVNGPAPSPQMDAAHICGNGHLGCVHPKHLRWATRAANIADSYVHGTMVLGADRHNAKLTEETVREIRTLAGVIPQTQVATLFGVSTAHVSRIQTRRQWAWLD